MTVISHPVAPEEIMAMLDCELSRAEQEAVLQHIDACAECAAMRDQLRNTSRSLAQWTMPEPSAELDRAIAKRADAAQSARKTAAPEKIAPLRFGTWRLWAIGGGGAVLGAVVSAAMIAVSIYLPEPRQQEKAVQIDAYVQPKSTADNYAALAPLPASAAGMEAAPAAPLPVAPQGNAGPGAQARSQGQMVNGLTQGGAGIIGGAVNAPMIARTVSLTILVRNIAASRNSLDGILAQFHGYAAQLTINTPENGSRSFQSSLRIPASSLTSALEALRTLGPVQTESQSGEEVTQQHADLVARLTNARETEQRLRGLLQQRTGKMQDVLDVEEKVSETRGEIEQMEAEQKALEHRVDFATVNLQLTEEYKAQLGGPSMPVSARMRNSFIAGIQHAGASLLGFILFLEEALPVTLIWIVILGAPVYAVWRYRRARRSRL